MFIPKLRFIVMSDIHIDPPKDCVELARLRQAFDFAYNYADNSDYKKIDAFVTVGDFASSGAREEMLNFKEVLDEKLRDETQVILSMASHEYRANGEDGAKALFKEIFDMPYDVHKVVNGFHFISVSSTRGCNFDEPQKEFARKSLEQAAADSPDAPIFFFQHPHISGTVYGSINWGEDALYPILMNYPQVIDFSGHSHSPINDPRSIHQKHFTSLGTGSLSYFELDEFDKWYGTIPPNDEQCAQFLIVEADSGNRVRVYPVDVLTGNFFHEPWKIDCPSEPSTFMYTDKRYNTSVKPHFSDDVFAQVSENDEGVVITFPQAQISEDRVNDYKVVVRNENSKIVRQICAWSGYYFYNMPETISVPVKGLEKGKYTAEITAKGFWNNESDNSVKTSFEIR